MPQARKETIARNIARGRRSRQRRKRQRTFERSTGELSSLGEKSQNLKDDIRGSSKELGLLGLEVGNGLIREICWCVERSEWDMREGEQTSIV